MKSCEELREQYAAYIALDPPNTRDNRKRALQHYYYYLETHDLHPCEITSSILHDYLQELMRTYSKASSVQTYMYLLKGFYRFLYETGELETHPDRLFTRELQRKMPKLTEPVPQVFSFEDWQKLWAACSRKRAAFLYLLYYCGPRIGAYLQCTLDDFDPVQGTLTIRESKTQVTNTILLSKQGITTLEEHIRDFRGQPAHKYLFSSRFGTPWQPRDAQRWLRNFTKRILGTSYPPKAFRASLITHMYDRGATDSEIVAITGHKSLAVLKHYKKRSLETQRKILKQRHPLMQKEALQEEIEEQFSELDAFNRQKMEEIQQLMKKFRQ